MTLLETNLTVSREPVLVTTPPWLDDVISPDRDSCAVFVLFVGFYFTDNIGIGGIFVVLGTDITVQYDVEGSGSFNTLRWFVGDFPTPW